MPLEFSHPDIEKLSGVDLGSYTTLKAQIYGDLYIVKSIDSLRVTNNFATTNNLEVFIIGWGANIVITKTRGVLFLKLKLNDSEDFLEEKDEYIVSASMNLNKLTSLAMKFSIAGWDVFTGIPATVGGALVMNAGTRYGEIGPLFKEVTILKNDNSIYVHTVNSGSFSYRKNNFLEKGDIILSGVIKAGTKDEGIKSKIRDYLKARNTTQPLGSKNCGCVFKNNPNFSAGKVIDELGMKGFEYKGFRVSPVHANFIENFNNGTYTSFLELIELLKSKMLEYTGEKFELEVKVY